MLKCEMMAIILDYLIKRGTGEIRCIQIERTYGFISN